MRGLLAAAAMLLALAAAAPARAGAVAALREFLAQTKTARGEFTQQVTRGQAQAAPPSSGTFFFERPGKFRWIYAKPYEQVLVADGERLFLYDKDLNQVTERRLADSLGSSPAAILFGSNELERSFTLKEGGESDGLAWLDALPKEKDAGFESIAIGFRGGLPEAMEVRDAFGRTTRFAFSAIERNPGLDPATFRFVAPQGADVIRQ